MQLHSADGRAREAAGVLIGLALAHTALHLITNVGDGIFRDELYYIACSDRLAWGYVDHPPLSIAALALTRRLLGDSVFAIRLPLALAGGLAVFLTGRLARRFGGGFDAEWIAALAYAVAAIPLVMFGFFSMNGFDLLFWIVCAHLGAQLLAGTARRRWLLFGAAVGLGLLNKYSIGFFAGAFVLALLLTSERRGLWNVWPWIGGAVAGAIFLPHVLWEVDNAWPTLEFIRNAQAMKITAMSPLQFFAAQIVEGNPFIAPLWLSGLIGLLFSARLRRYRAFGLTYLLLLLMFIAQQAKPYYLAPAYPFLLAAGAVIVEPVCARRTFARVALACWLVAGGVAILPMGVPILSPAAFVRYAAAVGLQPAQAERNPLGSLPQHFADRFGWENMARTVAHVYSALPANERNVAAIVAGNYGEAGAIDYFGPALNLPRAISGHNNYWLWGYGAATGEVLITVGLSKNRLDELCSTVELRATVVSPHAMPFEANLPVYVCRKLKVPMAEAWALMKRFV
jgi:hypothetical protein